uniref:GOLD domain-containing protein n=1 Tax=Echeneis naucrates TaxID=173247 RepID=A0A665TND9_ECHNA
MILRTLQDPGVMLFSALLITALRCQSVWARKSEPALGEGGAGLFRGSNRYHFAVEVPAAQMECFWHFAHQSGTFYLMFMVRTGPVEPARDLRRDQSVGQMKFQTEVTGFYRLCFGNRNNQFGAARVYLNFGVIYEGSEESESEMEGEEVLNSTLAGIQERVQKIQIQIFHMWRHYNFARMRKGKDHYVLLDNLSYVDWWSAAQSLLVLLSGFLQLHVLKRLFHTDPRRAGPL